MALNTRDFEYIRDLVRVRSAIVLDNDKDYLVELRLSSIVQQEGFASLQDFITHLRAQPVELMLQRVVDVMTTNETYFFRDVFPFEALKNDLIPELLKQNASSRRLRIWCGAASSGQEPFSLAMLLRENFPQLATWNTEMVATDISHEMIARCKEGRFSQLEVNRGLPAMLLVKYFRKDGDQWILKDDIRQMVQFRLMNLIQPWSLQGPMDLIMIRNVLIYFDLETKRAILAKVKKLMGPHSVLILGSSESVLSIDRDFEQINMGRFLCYRLKQELAQPVAVAARI
ncbi:MAG: protein-glutamate O-methyltransferase CheR [Calditrichaeota bacterium]|nr:protein-glutamate O-methyltransferase CheR [Candidatus Cloacimonadota bacterium]MCA9785831.1 protein-glutamate O-methyltransferase CheR [Candidatus Cloacimonadota bacterium]MCB1046320.1 protein-glutamate O-methyltransferase CheR [Calditrichota bacterium]